ncbi:UDP-3-O-[3-hydroxymyristoyl] N-acetylglucosamine deacetylase [candidate division WOR-1 bacterium RIFOXYB2_FULL_37_13]|uniref:UDP-3-O-acyl-N-acetylglucosamine deacetylase n=1 Tax=candidate division WOR-1 bacterium RIFOXYB2_FULL_37_13 TaxID=1802579 RepID=A0A1F4SM27_UNCSA|nr:MAG: UDP-3-O-[3-hydroxymyristoyl] N-acetylglucosamine deacetylase [candidate division WOR-1 bacterium RIFOXYB2_FULL_37_13]
MFQSKDGNPVKTISKKGSLSGIGLHSGEKSSITFSPSDSGEINFIFKNKRIRACVENVTNTTRGTSLGDLQTIEHILAAADGLGINSLEIGLSAKELPNMDGSALPFVAALIACKPKALKQNKEPIIVKERIFLEDQNASIEILPYEGFCIDFETCFVGLGKQNFTFNESTNFITEIAPARTFGYKEEVEELKKHGLAKGASLENSLVLNKKKGYVNVARFEEEPVRHKILDLIGDLSLIGRPIKAKIIAKKSGHKLNIEMAKKIAAGFYDKIVLKS